MLLDGGGELGLQAHGAIRRQRWKCLTVIPKLSAGGRVWKVFPVGRSPVGGGSGLWRWWQCGEKMAPSTPAPGGVPLPEETSDAPWRRQKFLASSADSLPHAGRAVPGDWPWAMSLPGSWTQGRCPASTCFREWGSKEVPARGWRPWTRTGPKVGTLVCNQSLGATLLEDGRGSEHT